MFVLGCAREHLTPAHLEIIKKAQTDIEDHRRDKEKQELHFNNKKKKS